MPCQLRDSLCFGITAILNNSVQCFDLRFSPCFLIWYEVVCSTGSNFKTHEFANR